VAVDIFRERVFLRCEEHGSRIISLVQLREEELAAGREGAQAGGDEPTARPPVPPPGERRRRS